MVSNHVSSEFAKSLAQQNVSVAEWAAMRRLYDGPGMKPTELAITMGLTQGAISKVIDKLEAKRWVVSLDDQADRRAYVLSLTKTGREAVPMLSKIADQNDDRFFGPLSRRDRQTLRKLLGRMAESHHWHDIPTS